MSCQGRTNRILSTASIGGCWAYHVLLNGENGVIWNHPACPTESWTSVWCMHAVVVVHQTLRNTVSLVASENMSSEDHKPSDHTLKKFFLVWVMYRKDYNNICYFYGIQLISIQNYVNTTTIDWQIFVLKIFRTFNFHIYACLRKFCNGLSKFVH